VTSVSVCVTNYNYERYLAEALDSVLAQSVEGVQVVVVDDGSTDDSLAVLEPYVSAVVLLAKPNGGQASAMNAGFAAATGDLVLFLDADDVLLPGALAAFVASFDAQPDVVKVASPLTVIDDTGELTGEIRPPAHWELPRGDLRSLALRRRSYVWPASSGNCYRRSALERCMPILEEDFRIEADLYLASLIVLQGPISALDTPVVGYRVHGSNNYAGRAADASFLHQKMQRIEDLHRIVRERTPGSVIPEDPAALADPSYLAYRLGSLVLDPATHPHSDDRRWKLGVRCAWASATHPGHPLRSRVRRTAWATGVGLMPARFARGVVGSRFS
jgi:glycosyltransferase involved in cell wall biosynthesis